MLAPVAGPAELVLSNILRTVNVTLLPAIRQALVPAGLAIIAGM
jgi:ribosomal protein L11 methylase PrmA